MWLVPMRAEPEWTRFWSSFGWTRADHCCGIWIPVCAADLRNTEGTSGVFGERMIEQQIKQLHEVGITDITIAVGI